MTQAQRIEALIEETRRRADEHGLSVRCPECNAGIGKYCLVDMSVPHMTADQIVKHEARVALAAAR